MKLGSLFDGIGGFPLSGVRHGIEPVWASEIEPWPIKVTQHHFPNMKHLGDITKINGAEIEPVDIITFGSPCTRLSVAGKHDGFDINFECQGNKDSPHEIYSKTIRATDKYQYEYTTTCPVCGQVLFETNESALFFHAIRVIREMRDATNGTYPRLAVWENVPGAFSSNKGEDFRAVLEEIAEAEIPMPTSGKWAEAGMVRTERIDVAWRTLDAQYWGVPQRRKRIFLVADFAGQCAGEILFEREGLRGDSAESGKPGQAIAGDVGDGVKKQLVFQPRSADGCCRYYENGIVPTLDTAQGGGLTPCVIRMREGCNGGGKGPLISEDKSLTLGCANDQTVFVQTYGICSYASNSMKSSNPHSGIYKAKTARTLDLNGGNPACNQGGMAICIQGSMIGREDKNGPQGDGINDEVSFTLNTTDRHAVATYRDGGQVSDCLDCSMLSKGQMMPDKRREPAVMEPIAIDHVITTGGNCTAQGPCVKEGGPMFTLKAAGSHAVAFQPGNISRQAGADPSEDVFPTLGATTLGDQFPHVAFACNQRDEVRDLGNKSGALQAEPGMKQQTFIARTLTSVDVAGLDCRNGKENGDLCGTLQAKPNGGFSYNCTHPVRIGYAVRRLTPLECLRLQGFPDDWLDIEGMSDTAKYKAVGNSVAVPCVEFVMAGIPGAGVQ